MRQILYLIQITITNNKRHGTITMKNGIHIQDLRVKHIMIHIMGKNVLPRIKIVSLNLNDDMNNSTIQISNNCKQVQHE